MFRRWTGKIDWKTRLSHDWTTAFTVSALVPYQSQAPLNLFSSAVFAASFI